MDRAAREEAARKRDQLQREVDYRRDEFKKCVQWRDQALNIPTQHAHFKQRVAEAHTAWCDALKALRDFDQGRV